MPSEAQCYACFCVLLLYFWVAASSRPLCPSLRWYMSEYQVDVEWYWRGKTEELGAKPTSLPRRSPHVKEKRPGPSCHFHIKKLLVKVICIFFLYLITGFSSESYRASTVKEVLMFLSNFCQSGHLYDTSLRVVVRKVVHCDSSSNTSFACRDLFFFSSLSDGLILDHNLYNWHEI